MAKVSEKTNDTKSTTTSNSGLSMIHIVLLCSIFVGVGAIGGYGIFYSIYNHRCSDMLDDAERRFNASQQELQNKLIESMHKSHESTGQESELLELRGRLEGHTDLMGKHQALLGTHHATVEQLTKLQAQHEQLRQQMSSVESELRDANLKVKELEKNVNVVGVQKDGLEQRLKQANAKVQELQGQAGDCGPDVECEAQLTKTMTYIQQLHSGLSKKIYGGTPYNIQFQIAIEGDDNNDGGATFTVEVSALESLPHSVYTFLSLVDHGVYNDAGFLSTQSIIHVDSDENEIAKMGYAANALSLVESSTLGPCTPYSVGFVGATGGLKIIMTNDVSKHGSLACFGKITQGRQTVSRIQRAAKEGKSVVISNTKQIQVEGRPPMSEGEL